jgi:hypothetical protein
MANTIYFPHIPKCGGTSVKKFIQRSGLSVFIDYDHPPSHKKYYKDLSDRRNKEFLQLNFDVFDIVFGHYPIKRYKHNANVILLLRHPVDRAISHFNYWKYVIPESNLNAVAKEPLVKSIKDGECDFINFLQSASIDNFYLRYLGELELSDVKRVFFTNKMDELYYYLLDYFNLNLTIPNARERENKIQKDDISKNDLQFAYKFLREEIQIYEKFGGAG